MAAKDISQERLSDMSDLENDAVPDTFHDNEYNADQTTAGNNVADSRNTDKGDVVILYHETCRDIASRLKTRLLSSQNRAGNHPFTVLLGEEFETASKTELANLDDLVVFVRCILILIEEKFCRDKMCCFKADVTLCCSVMSIEKYDFVIPVFMKEKDKISGVTPILSTMTGIKYVDEIWNDKMVSNFQRQIRKCLTGTNHLENSFQQLQLTDDD